MEYRKVLIILIILTLALIVGLYLNEPKEVITITESSKQYLPAVLIE